MKDLKAWFQKRELHKKEAEVVVETPQSLGDLLLSVNKETSILLKSYLSNNGKVDLEQIESFIKNPDAINQLHKNEPKFYQSFLKEEYIKYAEKLCKALYYLSEKDLTKAIAPYEFKSNIVNSIDDNGKNVVDHKNQMIQFPAHLSYVNFLKHPKEVSGLDFGEGIASKLVHSHQNEYLPNNKTKKLKERNTFMIKPYHPTNDEAELTEFPLHGWATMTTKALFNSGGIGHLCEDVGVHEHEGKPITVHKFNNKADMIIDKNFKNKSIDPLEISQIGVMDYLANNLDRHGGNLMVYKDKSNKHHLMGIDHERNFVYRDTYAPDYDAEETPFGYSNVRGLDVARRYSSEHDSHKPLTDWWNKNGMNIQKEFANQVGSIKDPAIRKHVYDNFMHRWERMDEWSKLIEKNKAYKSYNASDLFEPAEIKKFKQPINQEILKAIPKKAKDGVSFLYDIVGRAKNINHKQASQLEEAFSSLVKKMNPEEMKDIYATALQNPYWDGLASKRKLDIKRLILNHLMNPEEYHNNKKVYKLNHIKELADHLENLPEYYKIQRAQGKKLKKLFSKVAERAA